MPIESLSSYPVGSRFEADIVIIGSGPVGLTIALEFANSATQILIVESGLEMGDPAHRELDRLESLGEPRGQAALAYRKTFFSPTFDHAGQPFGARYRVFGGSGGVWGGKAALFDNLDFDRRAWVRHSGWPVSRNSLEPYFERAAEILNLGPNLYDERLWNAIGRGFIRPPIDNSKLTSFFWQFSRSRLRPTDVTNFVDEFKAAASNNIRALMDATVVHIDTDADGKRFTGLDVSTLDGRRSHIRAKLGVLAAGGIENARLLLNSNRVHRCGLGNNNDVVGRYLMDHPGARIGYFKGEDINKANFLGFYALPYKGQMIMCTHGLALSPKLQESEKLLNTAIYVWPEVANDDPIAALRRLAKLDSSDLAADLSTMVSNSGILTRAIGTKIFYKVFPRSWQSRMINLVMAINPSFVVREFQSKGVPHKLKRMNVCVITEQVPDPDSRITLSDQKDALGLPRVKAFWKISDAERRSVVRIGRLLLEELPKAGLPAPVLDEWIVENRPFDAPLTDSAHMMGATRMSDDPKSGVVDSRCEVHGVKGLYISGGSVFPTSGHANPTLMILSLALRTADQLKQDIAMHDGSWNVA